MTIVVTGATRGLGLAIARRLMKSGERVITVGRDGCDVVGDLSRMDDINRVAIDLGDVDVLINNAGVSKFTREVTPDGLEVTFATNYLAPFLLSNLLLDRLKAIVNITSEQHRWVRAIPWDDLQGERHFNPIRQYSLTKLYEVLFTRELARRAANVKVNCVSPGFLRTNLGREARGSFRLFLTLARPFQQSPDHGARNVLSMLDAPVTGAYFRGAKEIEPSALARDQGNATRLWEISERLAGVPGGPALPRVP